MIEFETDSRLIKPGQTFVAIKGHTVDGHDYIEKAIDIIIQIDRLSDGKRKVTSISEVVGIKDDKVNLKEIFAFKENGLSEHGEVRGEFILYKHTPKVYDRMKRKGIILKDIFGE